MKRRMFAVAAAVLLAGCAPQGSAPASAPSQTVWGAQRSCTTSSAGVCTLPHDLGVVPDAVSVSLVNRSGMVRVQAKSATTVTVLFSRSIASSGTVTPWASVPVTAELVAVYTPAPEPTAPASSEPASQPTTTPTTPPPATGWPDASNTGVPTGTTLTAYTGPCTITAANTVIDSKTVNCAELAVRVPGVQITKSRIIGSVTTPDDMATTAAFTLTDSEVSFPTIDAGGRTMVMAGNFTVLRSEITGGNRGIYCRFNCTVRDSWVHGTMVTSTLHASAVRASQNSHIVHNTLHCDVPDNASGGGCSADLTGYPDFEPTKNWEIRNNLFKATPGGVCAYGGGTAGKPYSGDPANATGIQFIDNVFEKGTTPGDHGTPVCAFYMPVMDYVAGRTGNVFQGNTYDDGAAVPIG